MVEISPSVLEYKPPFTKQATELITIRNDSEQAIAFKVKTTAPKVYCVRPNAALVAPGESVEVQVILLGLKEEPAADFKCKDKFLVIALPAPYNLGETSVADAWPQLEAEFKDKGLSKKIKVNYLLDVEPSTAQEPVAEEAPEVVDTSAKEATTEAVSTGVETKTVEDDTTVQKRNETVSESEVMTKDEKHVENGSNTPVTSSTTSDVSPGTSIGTIVGLVILVLIVFKFAGVLNFN